MKYSIDVIIPVYKPDVKFERLLKKIMTQTVRPGKVIILNTDCNECHVSDIKKIISRCYAKTADFDEKNKSVIDFVVRNVPFREYNHGGTRDFGTRLSEADFYMFMTQDAVPADNFLIERIMKAFDDKDTAVAYARQEAWMNAGIIEKFTRIYNYPEISSVKSKKDIKRLGVKTFFCSDVCAVYRASDYKEAGGFEQNVIFNEDMILAARYIKLGKKVAYRADAKVFHSHRYTIVQMFKRSFDMAVSQADHPDIFKKVSSEREGVKYFKKLFLYLLDQRKYLLSVYFILQCMAKYLGYVAGKNYRKLPKKIILKCTMNQGYWK